jgi:hypothetical protein
VPSPCFFDLHARLHQFANLKTPSYKARFLTTPIPRVLTGNIDLLLPPFSDGCRQARIPQANCGGGHTGRCDGVTELDRLRRAAFAICQSLSKALDPLLTSL